MKSVKRSAAINIMSSCPPAFSPSVLMSKDYMDLEDIKRIEILAL